MLEVIQRDGTRNTIEDPAAALEILRHSTSHLMALAVLELFPGTHLGIGPATAEGFYYDFQLDHTFSEEDLARIDEEGRTQSWDRLPRAEAELLQHEVDHLRGVLATDLALDARSLVYRSAFEADPEYFTAQVDYVIRPTI